MSKRLAAAIACTLLACGTYAQEPATLALAIGGEMQSVDVFRPDAQPVGVAIVAHGFTRSRARHRDLGQALAAAGIVAVIPDLPNVISLIDNGEALAQFAKALEKGAIPSLAVTRDRLVLIGTSAGGLASAVAASQLPGIAGWIGLDPVDRTGSGVSAASRIGAPAVVLLAEPSMCNLMGSGRAIAGALAHRWRTVEIGEATHCDFEDPTNNLCQALCGGSSDGARSQVRAEIVVTALEMLGHPPAPRAALTTTSDRQ
jgi:dienelactone hydrolase